MKKLLTAALALGFVFLVGCVTPPSLQTPRPLAPGEAEVGVHGTALFPPLVYGEEQLEGLDEVPELLGSPSFSARVGVIDHLELGATVGPIGAYGVVKYGILPYESPLQISALAGYGRWGVVFIPGFLLPDDAELQLNFPSWDIGVLAGYDVLPELSVYGGARQYWIGQEGEPPIGRFALTNAIAGVELLPNRRISFPIELNVGILNAADAVLGALDSFGADVSDTESPPEDVFILWPSVNMGLTIHF
ncbi:MAG: hypothetical protein ACLFNQ_13085 [Spirochaetaceae bacterium]